MPLRRATASVDRLTLEQKVGQMFMLAFAGSTAASAATLLRDHHVGACYLSNDNLVDPAQSATLMAELQGLARAGSGVPALLAADQDRKSTRLNSSHEWSSYAVFCLKKKT